MRCDVSRAWHVVRPTIKLLAATASTASAAGLAAQQVGIWSLPRWLLIVMVATVAVVATAASLRSAYWEVKGPRDQRLKSDVGALLRGAAREIAAARELDRDSVGVSAFEVRRRWIFWQRLERVYRERGHSNPPPSGIDWTKGKGVIGLCWAQNKCVFRDLKGIANKHADCTNEQFQLLENDIKMGLSYDEFVTIIGKYSSVIAFPITDDGNFIGCIAVDLPLSEGTKTSLNHSRVREIAGITAASVGKILRPAS